LPSAVNVMLKLSNNELVCTNMDIANYTNFLFRADN